MKKLLLTLTVILSSLAIQADNIEVEMTIPHETNYALYPVETGVFLRLDTRSGIVVAVTPSTPNKSRLLTSVPLANDSNKPGRFVIYPTDNIWEVLIFDTTTGDMWLLKWSEKINNLKKVQIFQGV